MVAGSSRKFLLIGKEVAGQFLADCSEIDRLQASTKRGSREGGEGLVVAVVGDGGAANDTSRSLGPSCLAKGLHASNKKRSRESGKQSVIAVFGNIGTADNVVSRVSRAEEGPGCGWSDATVGMKPGKNTTGGLQTKGKACWSSAVDIKVCAGGRIN